MFVIILLLLPHNFYFCTGDRDIEIVQKDADSLNKLEYSFALWPSVHNGVKLTMHKRDAQSVTKGDEIIIPSKLKDDVVTTNSNNSAEILSNGNNLTFVTKPGIPEIDFNKPGVLTRALIVFGGFGLLAIAYFIFYRRRSFMKDNVSNINYQDGPQFRYGVLQSDDRSDQLELSRMMETDEDDEDDLEIFDLGQKKKSLSYVNLKSEEDKGSDPLYKSGNSDPQASTSDNNAAYSDAPLQTYSNANKDQLLLEIDDRTSDSLINLNSSNTKIN